MADGEKVAGTSEKGPTGHGLTNRGHGVDMGVMVITPRPFMRPRNGSRGDCHGRRREELSGVSGNGPRGHNSRRERHETKEGEAGFLTADEMEAEMDRRWLAARNGGWRSPANVGDV